MVMDFINTNDQEECGRILTFLSTDYFKHGDKIPPSNQSHLNFLLSWTKSVLKIKVILPTDFIIVKFGLKLKLNSARIQTTLDSPHHMSENIDANQTRLMEKNIVCRTNCKFYASDIKSHIFSWHISSILHCLLCHYIIM